MSRYIDADAVITAIAEFNKYEDELEYPYASDDLEEYKDDARLLIEDAPSIDIVRCKECKHWCNHKDADYDQNDFMYYCAVHKVSFSGKDFCSYGEREGE